MGMNSGLASAIAMFETQKGLADALEVSEMTISKWKHGQVPAARCKQIEKVTRGAVTREVLRPDIFL